MTELEHGKDCGHDESGSLQNTGWDWEKVDEAIKRLAALSKEKMRQTYDDSSLPSTCAICKRRFIIPVETSCKHYFCSHCAEQQHLDNHKCFECGKPTDGLFKAAHYLALKMEREARSKPWKPSKSIRKQMLDEDVSEAKVWNLWNTSEKHIVDEDEQDKDLLSGSIVVPNDRNK